MKETIYIAGAITGNSDYKNDFQKAEKHLKENGFDKILNPTVLPETVSPANIFIMRKSFRNTYFSRT